MVGDTNKDLELLVLRQQIRAILTDQAVFTPYRAPKANAFAGDRGTPQASLGSFGTRGVSGASHHLQAHLQRVLREYVYLSTPPVRIKGLANKRASLFRSV